MEFTANEGKNVGITVDGQTFYRHAIQTHFVTQADTYVALLQKYVCPVYESGDIVSISEKVISICQGRVIRREDMPVGAMARFLSRFADRRNRGGYGVGMAVNMQYAINKAGLLRVLAACWLGALGKLLGVHGIFYRIVGREVSGLDGFYDGAWDAYRDIGIEIPANPDGVCDEIAQKLGIRCMIVDANDFGQVILGKSRGIGFSDETLAGMIRDNPAGQGQQCTPFVLIRKV